MKRKSIYGVVRMKRLLWAGCMLVACSGHAASNVYNFVGVDTSNDGIGGNPIAIEHDSDVFPWTIATDQNSSLNPNDAEYVNISANNSAEWATVDPGNGDTMATTFRFTLTEAVESITSITIHWNGNADGWQAANHSLWLRKVGEGEFGGATTWQQLGSSLSINQDTDTDLIRTLSSGIADYVDGGDGTFEFVHYQDFASEDARINYIQVIVYFAPSIANAPATNITTGSAFLNGNLVSTGGAPATVHVYWGDEDRTNDMGAWDHWTNFGERAEGELLTTNVTGLLDDTTYYYRFYATNSYGDTWASSAESFGTLPVYTNWPYKMKIRFSGYDRNETLTNFPAIVKLSESLPSFLYEQFASTTGGDLRFANSNETQVLNYEVEEWDTNGNSYVWVQVPLLVDSNTYIWAYWGNTNSATAPIYTTNGSTWNSDYAGVWHFNGSLPDSTANGNDGTSYGSINAAGKISGGQYEDKTTNSFVDCGSDLSLLPTTAMTVEVWAKTPSGYVDLWDGIVVRSGRNDWRDGYGLFYESPSEVRFYIDEYTPYYASFTGLDTERWYHMVGTWDGDNISVYVDGVKGAVTNNFPAPIGALVAGNTFQIGSGYNDTWTMDGYLDEIRLSSIARSTNWIRASWKSQDDPDQFNTCSLFPLVSNVGASNITTTAAKPYGDLTSDGGESSSVWLYWGTNNAGTDKTGWTTNKFLGALSTGLFFENITDLIANQPIFYRCYASNSIQGSWAPTATAFTTEVASVSFSNTPYQVNEGATSQTVTVTLGTESATDVTVNFATSDGTAMVSSNDYTATNGLLVWAAGETGSKTFVVAVSNDVLDELDETINITLSAPTNCTISGSNTTVSIIDDDGSPSIAFALSSSSGAEASASPSLLVTLPYTNNQDITAQYGVIGGTASIGTDYALASGIVTIAIGNTSASIDLSITNDAVYEGDETIIVGLISATNTSLGLITNHTYTIIEDDYVDPSVDNSSGAIGIFATLATLRSEVLSVGSLTPTMHIFWGPADGGTNQGSWLYSEDLGSSGVGIVSTNITGLNEGVQYFYRAFATNAGGFVWASSTETFIPLDPPSASLLVNGGFEIAGATADDAVNWGRSDTGNDVIERKAEFPRTDSYTFRFYDYAQKYIYGTGSNDFRVSWNGQYAAGGTHPAGGVRPGFVLSGSAYTKGYPGGSGATEFRYAWTNYDADITWMSNSVSQDTTDYSTGFVSVNNASPVPVSQVDDRCRPVLRRITSGTTDHYADDLTISTVLPKLVLSRLPENLVTFAPTGPGGSSDLSFGARCLGGGAGTVLYGAYITNSVDLTSSTWNGLAWYVSSDPSNAFSVVSNATLVATNDAGWEYATIRFSPPSEGSFTGKVRIATTDPTSRYTGGGILPASGSIIYEEYTLVGSVVTTPEIDNVGVTNLSSGNATFVADMTSTGAAPSYVWLFYGTSDGGTTKASWDYTNYVGLSFVGDVTTAIPTLSGSQRYYYTFYASNSYGGIWASEGISTNFITTPPASYVDDITIATTMPLNIDRDTDGLSDAWEIAYFGAITNSSGGSDDWDGDGWTDRSEYIAGTDPDDGNSYLKITAADLTTEAGNDVTITVMGAGTNANTIFAGDVVDRRFVVSASTAGGGLASAVATAADDMTGAGTIGVIDADAVTESAQKFYQLVSVSFAGQAATNSTGEIWGMYRQSRAPNVKQLVAVPVVYGGTNDNLNAQLGNHLARGLFAGEDTSDTNTTILSVRTNNAWVDYYLLTNASDEVVWWDAGAAGIADLDIIGGDGVTLKTTAGGQRARTNAVFIGLIFTNQPPITITTNNPNAKDYTWNIFGWTRWTNLVYTGGSNQLGLAALGKGGVAGDAYQSHDRLGDQIWIWNANTFSDYYWLIEGHSNSNLNGRWWNNRTGTFADFQFEPGRAYYYRHWSWTNAPPTGTNFIWNP